MLCMNIIRGVGYKANKELMSHEVEEIPETFPWTIPQNQFWNTSFSYINTHPHPHSGIEIINHSLPCKLQ